MASPPRVASAPKVTFEGAASWRESLGAFLAAALSVALLFSVILLGVYAFRNKAVYEELVDYVDKTLAISKINYNHFLGIYNLSEEELESLGEHRTYKTLLWSWLAADVVTFVFLTLALLLYFSTDVSQGTPHVIFWIVLGLGVLYTILEMHIFTFVMFPYSAALPNATEQLLNHAIPHNPGGLMQMEERLGCTFDHNLYAADRRRLNPQNTCDPQIESSFLSRVLLIINLAVRLLPIVLFALLAAKRTPLSEAMARLVERLRPSTARPSKTPRASNLHVDAAKSPLKMPPPATNFGVPRPVSTKEALPAAPSPGNIDHSISYNNAAFFATSGASSRSSDISRIDAAELFKPKMHTSNSVVSEV